MKVFQFSLETLLRVKCQAVHKIQIDIAHLQNHMLDAQEKWEEVQKEILSLEIQWNESRQQGKMHLETHYESFLLTLRERQKNLQKKLFKSKSECESLQKKLEKILQERKTIEKLKEKHYSLWKKAHDRADHDETALFPFSDS